MTDSEKLPLLALVLSLTAGYVDTSGFLALQGLFTAHVTGNFVTLGAALALGSSGAIAKLLALPAFCAVVIGMRLLTSNTLEPLPPHVRSTSWPENPSAGRRGRARDSIWSFS
jgi:uncharacterized membrane protein YoaK (UPF0700 family)